MARLILDTNAVIRLERHAAQLPGVSADDDIAIAAISLAELRHGVRAADEQHRDARAQFVEDIEHAVEILPYTRSTAAEHAVLLDHVRRAGRPRGAHDLIIAAHARQTGRLVVSLDIQARFGDLPGVVVAGG